MTIAQNVDALFARITSELTGQLEGFAQYAEDMTRSESEAHWQDDSGSARDSITAFVEGSGGAGKNTDRPNWSAARSPGYESPIWGNTPANFQPETEEVTLDADAAVVLTMTVPYADALELGENSMGSEPLHGRRRPAGRPPVVTGLLGKMPDILQDDFARAVAQGIGSGLA